MFREPNDGAVLVPNFLCAPRRRLLQTWLKHTLQSESHGIIVKWILKSVLVGRQNHFFGTVREPKDWFLIQGSAAMVTQSHAPSVGKKAKSAPFFVFLDSRKQAAICFARPNAFSSRPRLPRATGTKPREISSLLKSTIFAIDRVNQKYFFRNVKHMHQFSSSQFHVSRQSRGLVVVYMN